MYNMFISLHTTTYIVTANNYMVSPVVANFFKVLLHRSVGWYGQVVGVNKQPFLLSAKFFDEAAASRFPFGTGDEARSMIQWLAEHNTALDQNWVPLPTDNYCGQLIQLLGVISEGTVNVTPFLPKGGVGESNDNKNIVLGVKRKTEGGQEVRFVKPKIQRADASTPGFRRERGFPGIKVLIIFT